MARRCKPLIQVKFKYFGLIDIGDICRQLSDIGVTNRKITLYNQQKTIDLNGVKISFTV